MANLASVRTFAPPSVSRSQPFIQWPLAALDSSDEVRTDSSSSPSMNPTYPSESGATDRDKNGSAAAAPTPCASSSSGRRKMTGSTAVSDENKPASKQRKYERKTKRFIWPDDLHRLFVAAIFDVGLKNASPKALLTLMDAAGPNSGLTTEHLKSHLQKYRLNYDRSRMEFLEYYDRSAKRNLKRRRRQAQHRPSGASNEANTMFVFPISNSKRRKKCESESDSDDSDSDTNESNSNDSGTHGDAKRQEALQGRRDSSALGSETFLRSLNYSQLMQSVQQQPTNSHLRPQPSIPNDRMPNVAPAPASTGLRPIAPHHLPPAYVQAQRKQPSDHDRDLAVAAAAAVAAFRYPLGQLPGPVTGGGTGMPELTDPQWSILNSLMSPQLASMTGPFPQVATSEAMTRDGNSADGFMLHEEPSDLQMQMHLAMQAQMNLHRQMLTRKVKVAQHLARHSSMGRVESSSDPNNSQVPPRGYDESWGNVQQPYQHQQQQDPEEHYQQQQLNLLSRSSDASATQTPESTASVRGDTIVAAPTASEVPVVATSTADNGSTGASNSAAGLPTAIKGGDDGIDLYRWDRIDLNVELDDDDLFGFLKS